MASIHHAAAILLILSLGSAYAQAATSTPQRRKPATAAELRDARLAHARELMGRHYRKSVVRAGEKFENVQEFVQVYTRNALKKPWKKKAGQIASTILSEAEKHRFDPLFLMAVIDAESSFRPLAVGTSGEIGLMQIRPVTAHWISKKHGLKWRGARTLKDPVQNIRMGAALLSMLREEFDSHGQLYLAAYNMGATNVQRALDRQVWPKDYPANVMKHYVRYYGDLKTKMGTSMIAMKSTPKIHAGPKGTRAQARSAAAQLFKASLIPPSELSPPESTEEIAATATESSLALNHDPKGDAAELGSPAPIQAAAEHSTQ